VYRRETLVILQHYLDLARETRHHDGVGCQSADDSSLDRHLDAQTIRQTTPRVHQVDPFKPLIEERLRLYPALSSVRLLAECRAAGYVGRQHPTPGLVATVRPASIMGSPALW